VVCEKKYHTPTESEQMFADAGVEIQYFDNQVMTYENQ